jgi:hypothetical protein
MEKRIICLAVSLMIFGFSTAHAFTMDVEENIDRVGCDFKIFAAPSQETTDGYAVCFDACGADSSCQAWNLDRRSGTPMCFLKNCVPPPTSSVGLITGVKLPFTMSGVEFNIDRPGCDFKNFTTADFDAKVCSNACGADSSCQAWNLDRRSGTPTCFLKNCVPDPTSTASAIGNIISGVRFP